MDGKSFGYKTKIIGKISQRPAQPDSAEDGNSPPWPPVPTLNGEVTIPLKDLRKFWRSLDLPLINCEIQLVLSLTKDCVLIQYEMRETKFMITSTKLYIPVVALSINGNIKFLENIKEGFKRSISWNKYRSDIATQPKNNLDYFIDPT